MITAPPAGRNRRRLKPMTSHKRSAALRQLSRRWVAPVDVVRCVRLLRLCRCLGLEREAASGGAAQIEVLRSGMSGRAADPGPVHGGNTLVLGREGDRAERPVCEHGHRSFGEAGRGLAPGRRPGFPTARVSGAPGSRVGWHRLSESARAQARVRAPAAAPGRVAGRSC